MRKIIVHIFICFFLLTTFSVSAQQTGVIFGQVINANQQGILNVNITLAGLPGGTTSDKKGNFELTVPSGKKITVVFTYIGFETVTNDLVLKPGDTIVVP